jgi:hypothetical protein
MTTYPKALRLGPTILAVAMTLTTGQALAQALDVEFEGPIQDVTDSTITVMGITATVQPLPTPAGARAVVITPTGAKVELLDLKLPLPDRPQGFIGGTAIVTGTSLAGVVTATRVEVDVAENVVVGEVTPPVGGASVLRVNGVPLTPLMDDRLDASAHTELGFAIKVETLKPNTLAAAEGYWSANGPQLYYHDLAADAADLVHPDLHEVSIIRARCLAGGTRLELRGGAHPPQPQTDVSGRVRVSAIIGAQPPVQLDIVPVELDAAGFGRWRARVLDHPVLSVPDGVGGSRCPDELTVKVDLLKVDDDTVLAEALEPDPEVR